MKKLLVLALFIFLSVSACDGWVYQVPTFPAPPPTITPAIYTPTPVIATITAPVTSMPASPTLTAFVTSTVPTTTFPTAFPTVSATTLTEAPTSTITATLPPASSNNIDVEVLGCNTSIDITHGMGEVTNAYITMINNTGADLSDVCATLYALDEGRVHPDKTVCVPALAHGQQVTLKLTVDSTYKVDTPIQVEVKSGSTLLSRIGQESCTDIGLFAPGPGSLLTPVPIQ
jgi:hypothetical protein